MEQIKIHLITNDSLIIDYLNELLKEKEYEVVVTREWKQELFHQMDLHIYVIDEELVPSKDNVILPSTSKMILLIRNSSFENTRSWMKKAPFDMLLATEEKKEIVESIERCLEMFNKFEYQNHNDFESSPGHGVVTAFYSAKGGSGKTVLASAIAQYLQVQHEQRTILIDLNAQFGGVEILFGLEPKNNYFDLQPVISELSINHILNVAVTCKTTGVHILLGPSKPEQAERITDELISKVIRVCKKHFDHVILDLPSTLNTMSFTGLNKANQIYYIVTPDSASIYALKKAKSLFQKFQLGHKGELSIIVNRIHRKSELTEKDIAKITDLPILGSIRSDYFKIQPYLNLGLPFLKKKNEKPKSKMLFDVRKMVEKDMIK